ncbi:MAG: TolC family protein, partial [Thermodesulfobacteriota bacterium]
MYNKPNFIIVVFLLMLITSCASEINPYSYVPPSKDIEWEPDDEVKKYFPEKSDLPAISEDLEQYKDKLVLTQLVDVALQNSPVTEQAWAEARAAAAAWAVARGSYYPSVDGVGEIKRSKFGASSGILDFEQSTASIGLTLDYLLLDFGGRIADVEQAKQALINANWNQNQAIQNVLLNVSSAYYQLIGNKSKVEADIENLEEAQTSLDAAELRLEVGVGTLPDVLQAKSSLAQVELQLVSDRGQVKISQGNLATTVGWAANEEFDVVEVDEQFEPQLLEQNVDNLVEIAMKYRPDVAAILATVRQGEAAVKSARSALFPTLGTTGSFTEQYVFDAGELASDYNTNYQIALTLQIPIFHGFALRNAVRQAKAELEVAEAALKLQEQQVVSDVWDAYYNFQTAVQSIVAADKLLDSSLESFEASLERYRSGVGDIVELLNAQSTLANARSEKVQART